jgi:hypothetical protein
MTPPKLSDSQKQELVVLYRQGTYTLAALGQRFGVSTSTVGRIVKLAADDLESAAIAVDASSSTEPPAIAPPAPVTPAAASLPDRPTDPPADFDPDFDPQPPQVEPSVTEHARRHGRAALPAHVDSLAEAETGSGRRVRRRSRSVEETTLPLFATDSPPELAAELELDLAIAPPMADVIDEEAANAAPTPSTNRRPIKKRAAEAIEAVVDVGDDETASDLDNDLELDEDDDLDLDDEADLEFGDDDGESGILAAIGRGANPDRPLQILPLEMSRIPDPCYLVIDRSAELVACPLEDFRELGQIPPQEAASKILPVFDNHRVARRFSARNQRIVKVPNANALFQKTGPYLQAKGIKHLLIDGQVYLL